MLANILKQLHSDAHESISIIIDNSFAELFKWLESNGVNDSDEQLQYQLFDLSLKERDRIQKAKGNKVLIISSILDQDSIEVMKSLLKTAKCTECTLLTSVSPREAALKLSNHDENNYDSLINFFFPTHCKVHFFPLYSINMFPSTSNVVATNNVDLRILSSHAFRKMKPLTLHGLSTFSFERGKCER
jgi:hypothetical protein